MKLKRKQLEKAHDKWCERVSNSFGLSKKERNSEIAAAGAILAFDVAAVLEGVKVYD